MRVEGLNRQTGQNCLLPGALSQSIGLGLMATQRYRLSSVTRVMYTTKLRIRCVAISPEGLAHLARRARGARHLRGAGGRHVLVDLALFCHRCFRGWASGLDRSQKPSEEPRSEETAPFWNPTVAIYLGPYGGPRGGGNFSWARYPCSYEADI